jgi:NifU-like protein involved in Fe-S cluster formation
MESLTERIFDEVKGELDELSSRHLLNEDFKGRLEAPDGLAVLTGTCGDTIEISLKFENNIVKKALYNTDGCMWSNICGSLAAEMSIGKDPDEILDITGEAIIERLGSLPEKELHCASLASESLQAAVHDYMINKKK